MNLGWVLLFEQIDSGRVLGTHFGGLLPGTNDVESIRELLPAIFTTHVRQHNAGLLRLQAVDGVGAMFQGKPEASTNCVTRYDLAPDGAQNDQIVICESNGVLRLLAVRAENIAFDMDSHYKERLSWMRQDIVSGKDGVPQMGVYHTYSIEIEHGGAIERRPV